MTTDLDGDLDAQLRHLEAQQGAQPDAEPAFPTLTAFVTEYLPAMLERRIRHPGSNASVPARWCPIWFDHPEATARLHALWHAFEVLRLDLGTGMSVWWRDHLDPTWTALTGEYGPYSLCHEYGRHRTTDSTQTALSFTPPPDSWSPPAL